MLARRSARLGGQPHHVGAVLVGAREEEDVLAALAVMPHDDVGHDRRVRVADVRLRVDVVDRRGEVEALGHEPQSNGVRPGRPPPRPAPRGPPGRRGCAGPPPARRPPRPPGPGRGRPRAGPPGPRCSRASSGAAAAGAAPTTTVTSPRGGSASRAGDLGRRPADDLLVELGELAADGHGAVGQRAGDLGEQAGQPARALEGDGRDLQPGQALDQPPPLGRAPRREAEEDEAALARQPRRGQGGGHRAGTGDDLDRQVGVERGAHQPGAGIADQGHARVRDQRDPRAGAHARHQVGGAGGLVVLVDGHHRRIRAGVAQQRGRAARVLARDRVGPAEGLRGARRQIGQVADRRSHHHEGALARHCAPCLPLTEVAAADATIARRCPGPRSPIAATGRVDVRARSAAAWTSCARSARARPGTAAPPGAAASPTPAPSPPGARAGEERAPAPGAAAPGPPLVVAARARARRAGSGGSRSCCSSGSSPGRASASWRINGAVDEANGKITDSAKRGARPAARRDARHPHEHAHHRRRRAQGPARAAAPTPCS